MHEYVMGQRLLWRADVQVNMVRRLMHIKAMPIVVDLKFQIENSAGEFL